MRRSCLLPMYFLLIPMLAACSGPLRTGAGGGGGQIVVSVTPVTPTVNVFGTQQFSATVTGATNTAVNWQVNGVTGGSQATGFISSTGLFVAPGAVPTVSNGSGGTVLTTVTVAAVSQASTSASGSTAVTIQAATNQNAQSGAGKLGTSGGNAKDSITNGSTIACCSGTLGSLVTRNGTQYILSNNHVLAKSDFATAGDNISQPGLVDSNCTAGGTVANLSEFFNLQTGPLPKVDAAIAQVVPGKVDAGGNILLLGATQTNGVPDPGAPHAGTGIAATLNEQVAKSGRTTGLTCSSVAATGFAVSVQYTQNCDGTGTKFAVNYTNLVEVLGGHFSAEGDSGSLIVDQNSADPVALLFAGNDQDAVGSAISDVLNSFVGAGNSTPTFVGGPVHAVIGCTLPTKPASAVLTSPAAALPADALQKALAVRNAHGPELMAHPEVQAVGVGASYDNPEEATIVLFVTKGQPRSQLPAQVDGIRTRIIEGDLFTSRGTLSTQESAALEQAAPAPQLVYSISDSEVSRARVVQRAHVDELLKQPGVQGVGITASVDSPGEAALLVYLIRGVQHSAIPPVIDGLRTRVREGSRFRAGIGEAQPKAGCSLPAARTTKTSASTRAKPRP
jgi:hypothetical protein